MAKTYCLIFLHSLWPWSHNRCPGVLAIRDGSRALENYGPTPVEVEDLPERRDAFTLFNRIQGWFELERRIPIFRKHRCQIMRVQLMQTPLNGKRCRGAGVIASFNKATIGKEV